MEEQVVANELSSLEDELLVLQEELATLGAQIEELNNLKFHDFSNGKEISSVIYEGKVRDIFFKPSEQVLEKIIEIRKTLQELRQQQ